MILKVPKIWADWGLIILFLKKEDFSEKLTTITFVSLVSSHETEGCIILAQTG